MDNKDVAKKWFNKANNDLITAEYLLTMQSPPTDAICFHSQQVAEKYLKGFLTFHGREALSAVKNANKIREFILNKLKLS